MDFPKVLPPGKAGTIKVKVETGNSLGIHIKSVTIKSNDPDNPNIKVDLHYFVKQ